MPGEEGVCTASLGQLDVPLWVGEGAAEWIHHGSQHSCHPAGGWSLGEWPEHLSNGHRLLWDVTLTVGWPSLTVLCLVHDLAQWTGSPITLTVSSFCLSKLDGLNSCFLPIGNTEG